VTAAGGLDREAVTCKPNPSVTRCARATSPARRGDLLGCKKCEARGLRVLRFRNEMVLEELPEVVKKIKEMIRAQRV
jgi:Protein of unknown function (DUF559)